MFLSRWAVEHGNLTLFLLVLILTAGIFSLISMGQKEDPDFTFRTMVVQVAWPGASVHEMQEHRAQRQGHAVAPLPARRQEIPKDGDKVRVLSIIVTRIDASEYPAVVLLLATQH